jgi:uncharacterized protein (TIGR02271 family)
MLDNQGTVGDTMGRQFVEGTPVYDVNGDEVGHVSEHGVQDNSLVLHHGLLREDVYVPLPLIQRSDADGVNLSVSKDDVLNRQGSAMHADTARVPTDEMAQDNTRMATNDAILVDETGGSDDRVQVMSDQGGLNRTDATLTEAESMASSGGTTANWSDAGRVVEERADTTMARPAMAETTVQERVPVMEEQLVAGKREEEIGRVHLHKDVVEEPQTVTAQVTREQVEVERVPITDQGQTRGVDANAFQEEDIDIPLKGETLVAEKQPVEREEVRLHKRAVTEEQQVTDTVRKERVVADGGDTQTWDTSTTMRPTD